MEFLRLVGKGIKKKFRRVFVLFKKLLKILLVLTIIVGFATVFYFHTDNDLANVSLVGYTYKDNEYINTVDNDISKPIIQFISEQNDIIQKRFFDQKWKIVLDTKLPVVLRATFDSILNANAENEEYYSLNGLTVPKAKIMYLNSNNIDGETYNTFIHEFGHFIDYQFGYPSTSTKFEELYEMNKFCEMYNSYQSANSSEFFATSYMYYYCNAKDLQTRAPSVYSYIDELVKHPENLDGIIGIAKSGVLGTIATLKINIRDLAKQSL